MGSRTQLHAALCTMTTHVYFQPPESLLMTYPCIVYKRASARSFFSDNIPHHHVKCYEVTVIDKNPDGSIVDKLLNFPMTTLAQHFTTENLHHDVFTVYY